MRAVIIAGLVASAAVGWTNGRITALERNTAEMTGLAQDLVEVIKQIQDPPTLPGWWPNPGSSWLATVPPIPDQRDPYKGYTGPSGAF